MYVRTAVTRFIGRAYEAEIAAGGLYAFISRRPNRTIAFLQGDEAVTLTEDLERLEALDDPAPAIDAYLSAYDVGDE